MKNALIPFLFLSLITVGMIACKGEAKPDDSKEEAKEANETMTENTDLDRDIKFAINATDAGLLEVQLAQLAISKSKNAQVVELSKMIEEEHTKSNSELAQVAAAKNITVPSALSDKSNEKFNDLNSKQAEDFDKEYLKCLVDNHESSIKEFEKESENGNDLEIKTWATSKLPILQQHLDKAKALKDQMN